MMMSSETVPLVYCGGGGLTNGLKFLSNMHLLDQLKHISTTTVTKYVKYIATLNVKSLQ